jgi:integrase/recombinase XerD
MRMAEKQGPDIHAFCWLLAETGCRISEALAITQQHIDSSSCSIVFECLKKRRRGIFRVVPISRQLTDLVGSLSVAGAGARIWPWCRMTAWRHISTLLKAAAIHGPQASPKGLRHGFAVAALGAGTPLNLIQRWLGHSDIRTTAIYAAASGPEEREIAQRLWLNYPRQEVEAVAGPAIAGRARKPAPPRVGSYSIEL